MGKGQQPHCVAAVRHGDRMQGEANWGRIVKRGGAGLTTKFAFNLVESIKVVERVKTI